MVASSDHEHDDALSMFSTPLGAIQHKIASACRPQGVGQADIHCPSKWWRFLQRRPDCRVARVQAEGVPAGHRLWL
jgi:hypothetical protein